MTGQQIPRSENLRGAQWATQLVDGGEHVVFTTGHFSRHIHRECTWERDVDVYECVEVDAVGLGTFVAKKVEDAALLLSHRVNS